MASIYFMPRFWGQSQKYTLCPAFNLVFKLDLMEGVDL